MPIEILVDTMIQDKIIEGLKATSNDKSVPCFLEAIALGVQESTKLQRDILSILEEWQENQSDNSNQISNRQQMEETKP